MGLFDKVKGFINGAKERAAQQMAEKQEEERRKQEEERRKQEEAQRFNPKDKSLEWFSSEDGIKTFNEYITVQNYMLEEKIEAERKEKWSEYSLASVVSVIYKEAKLPSVFFYYLADSLKVQALEFVGTTNLIAKALSILAQPFFVDDDGELQATTIDIAPEEILSVEKNPVLNFAKSFNCFELKDDAQGSWDDKYDLWSSIVIFLSTNYADRDIISKNPWIFSKEAYFNDLGTVRKRKGFYKKCAELANDVEYKAYFEKNYNECE